MTLVAVETAGLDPGTTASSLHLGPAPLAQFAAGEHRLWETEVGSTGPSLCPACSSPIFLGTGRATLSHPACVMHGVFPHAALPAMGDNALDLGHHLSSQPARPWIQPSDRVPPGTAWYLQALMTPAKTFAPAARVHPPVSLPQAPLNITQTWGRWDTVTCHTSPWQA